MTSAPSRRKSSRITKSMTSSGRAWGRTPSFMRTVACCMNTIWRRAKRGKFRSSCTRKISKLAQNLGGFALSPSAARAVMEARGNIFTVPAEHGSIRTLTTEHSSIHELNPAWSPDGKWIAYLSDKTGEYEVYIRPQMGGDETRITTDGGVYRYGPTWSPDSKKLAYWAKL